MIDFNVIQNGRGGGKTYDIMTEIGNLVVAGRRPEILIVFPAINYLHFWSGEWRRRFGGMPMPEYVAINNTLKIRGREFSKIYVEDINTYEDGIYDQRLEMSVFPYIYGVHGDCEVVFTSSQIPTNQRSHSVVKTSQDVMAEKMRLIREERMLVDQLEIAAIYAKIIIGTDDRAFIDSVLSGEISAAQAVEVAHGIQQRTSGPPCRTCQGG